MPESGISRDFIGLNKGRPDTNLGPNEAADAKNVIFSHERIEKRRGSTRFSPWVIPKPSVQLNLDKYMSTPSITSTAYNQLDYRHGTQFTMEVCGRVDYGNLATMHCIAQRGFSESQSAVGWSLWFDETNRAFKYWEILTGAPNISFTGTYTNFSPKKPFHLAVVRDGAECRMWLKDNEFEGMIGNQTGLDSATKETHTITDYPMTFGWCTESVSLIRRCFDGRLQEFRTWDHARSTVSLQQYALKELPSFATATDSLKFYYKMNEGVGNVAYDYGYISRAALTTMTNAFAATFVPSSPTWVEGLVTGGVGDRAVRLDGIDDYIGWPTPNDEYATLRTGTSDWSVQLVVRPRHEIKDSATICMYGTTSFTHGSNGFSFRLKTSIDKSTDTRQFVSEFCFLTETANITWSTSFTESVTYGITLQRARGEARMRVDDLTNEISGAFSTVAVACPSGPGFAKAISLIAGADFPTVGYVPSGNYAHCDIDEIRIWRGLRDEDLTVSYAYPIDTMLLGYWKMNDGQGVTVSDSSGSQNVGYLLPNAESPIWVSGFVTPVEGPPVTGLFYYEKSEFLTGVNDARERSLLVCAGNSIYRNEGGKWNELETGRDYEALASAEQLGSQMAICNGVNDNRMYDGNAVYANGIAAPVSAGTASVVTLGTGLFDWIPGYSKMSCVDYDRTEPGYTFNGKRVQVYLGGSTGTIELRTWKYFKDRTLPLSAVSYGTHSNRFIVDVPSVYQWGLSTKTAAIEGAEMVFVSSTLTETHVIAEDAHPWYGQRSFGTRLVRTDVTTTIALTNLVLANCHVRLRGHFIWDTAYVDTIFGTSTYQIEITDSGITGRYAYRHTKYNRITKTESNPSPPSDNVTNPWNQTVWYALSTDTDTSCTDRLVYRTLSDGARNGPDYFLVGTATGTGEVVFADVTPSGYEGRLVSFYRDKPPKSAVCKAFKGRMWYVPVDYPNLLYFSTPASLAEVDPYNYLIFGDAADRITGLGISYDNLVVFKRRSTWIVSRSDVPAGMRPYRISDSVGCVAHHTIREVNGELLFLSEDGLYSLRGSDIRKVSGDKVQFYFDRLDPRRLSKAVAVHLRRDGIYRLNVAPLSLYATTVRSEVNSWYLDYHYQRSRDHVPFFEGIWSYGEREVSAYGQYVSEDGTTYPAYGDYRGFVYLDNIPENYTDGLGWYRGSTVWTTLTTADASLGSGSYTISVNASLLYDGDGLKGLFCRAAIILFRFPNSFSSKS